MLARYAALAILAAAAAYGGSAAAGPPSPLAQYAADSEAPIRCQAGMTLVLKAADMTPACVGEATAPVLAERGWAVEAPASMMAPPAEADPQDKQKEYMRAELDGSDARAVKDAVSAALAMYDESGDLALAEITSSAQSYDATEPYVFVLESGSDPTVLAHGALPERVGTEATPLLEADRPYAQILDELGSSGGAWVGYVFENPATGLEQSKKSWLVMRDGYIFGSGYYTETDEQAVKSAVSGALATYAESGAAALEDITASAADYDSSKPYVFVLELTEPPVVAAHGAIPERVGAVSKSLTLAERPYEAVMADLRSSEGTWVEYVFPNPATGKEQSKKSWLVLEDNYVFGSGYYVGSSAWESAAMDAVSEAIAMYDESGDLALAEITGSAQSYDATEPYVFVLDDAASPTILAHGAFPDRVDTPASPLLEADRPYADILEELRGGEGTWAEYVFPNPATGLEQSKKSWMVMRDGYIFGSGYYTETEAQAVKRAVSEAVLLFEAHGEAALASITASSAGYDPTKPYVFVLDGADEPLVVAHGAFPDRVGSPSKLAAGSDRPYADILQELRGGEGTWAEYRFMNPATDAEQLKRSWLSMAGGYVFGSGYYLAGS